MHGGSQQSSRQPCSPPLCFSIQTVWGTMSPRLPNHCCIMLSTCMCVLAGFWGVPVCVLISWAFWVRAHMTSSANRFMFLPSNASLNFFIFYNNIFSIIRHVCKMIYKRKSCANGSFVFFHAGLLLTGDDRRKTKIIKHNSLAEPKRGNVIGK